MRGSVGRSLAVFVGALVVYCTFAWGRLSEPSPQFHFVDLAHSFLNGRLDTDTPRRRVRDEKKDTSAPDGFYRAGLSDDESGRVTAWLE